MMNQRGYLLVGVLIAIVVLSVALTALAAAFTMATKSRSEADHRTMALRAIQMQFEQLEGISRSGIVWTNDELARRASENLDIVNKRRAGEKVDLNLRGEWKLVEKPALPVGFDGVGKDGKSLVDAGAIKGVTMTVSWWEGKEQQQLSVTKFFYTVAAGAPAFGGLEYVLVQ